MKTINTITDAITTAFHNSDPITGIEASSAKEAITLINEISRLPFVVGVTARGTSLNIVYSDGGEFAVIEEMLSRRNAGAKYFSVCLNPGMHPSRIIDHAINFGATFVDWCGDVVSVEF